MTKAEILQNKALEAISKLTPQMREDLRKWDGSHTVGMFIGYLKCLQTVGVLTEAEADLILVHDIHNVEL